MASPRDILLAKIQKADGGACKSIELYKNTQFGVPLKHYAQQYLYGCTGLRFGVFYSISGVPQACKSPYVFDLMFDICADREQGGPEGLGFLYELLDKLSMSLLTSMAAYHKQSIGKGTAFNIIHDCTLEKAITHLNKMVLANMKQFNALQIPPILIDWDSIGGAASDDLIKKFTLLGSVGKGFHDKAHVMKHLCLNWSGLRGILPIIVYAVNQLKPDVSTGPGAMPGATPMHVTGGLSQVFKAGHVISARFRNINNGAGKLVTLRTTKTSFCDPRRIEVKFVWNRTGTKDSDAQGHHWLWALASANILANPEFVGLLRDIVDVKISAQGLVTCPQLDCKSVIPELFLQALFDPANLKILNLLYAYQKIEKLNGMLLYYLYVKQSAIDLKQAKEQAKQVKAQLKALLAAKKKAAEEAKLATKAARLAKKLAAQKLKQLKADALLQKKADVVKYGELLV